ncbi:hypothetical protein [Corynebacterium aquilae]|nr:hypothetical protein [Corynebacterium aquilae]
MTGMLIIGSTAACTREDNLHHAEVTVTHTTVSIPSPLKAKNVSATQQDLAAKLDNAVQQGKITEEERSSVQKAFDLGLLPADCPLSATEQPPLPSAVPTAS